MKIAFITLITTCILYPNISFLMLIKSEIQPWSIVYFTLFILLYSKSILLSKRDILLIIIPVLMLYCITFFMPLVSERSVLSIPRHIFPLLIIPFGFIYVLLLNRDEEFLKQTKKVYFICSVAAILIGLGQVANVIPFNLPFITREMAFSRSEFLHSGRGAIGLATEPHMYVEPFWALGVALIMTGKLTRQEHTRIVFTICVLGILSRSAIWGVFLLVYASIGLSIRGKLAIFVLLMVGATFDLLGRPGEVISEIFRSQADTQALFAVFGNSFEFRFMPFFAPLFMKVDGLTFEIISAFRQSTWVGFPGYWGFSTITHSSLVMICLIIVLLCAVIGNIKQGHFRYLVLGAPIVFLTSINSFTLYIVVFSFLKTQSKGNR